MTNAAAPPTIRDLKAYVPAKDFALSQRFYTALGFRPTPGFGGTVDFTLGGHTLRLQDYYVADWANNSMFVLPTDDLDAWLRLATGLVASGDFPGAAVAPIQTIEAWRVLHVKDPSGVLLVFVANAQSGVA